MNLSTIKNKFFNYDRVLRTNRFAVDMTFISPVNGGEVNAVNEPAVAVMCPSVSILTAPLEYQNVPLNIPTKREAPQDLLIRFYAVESLNIYNQLLTIIKQYGGEPQVSNSRPTAYAPGTFYNDTIKNNSIVVKMLTADARRNTGADEDGFVNYIRYVDPYPSIIQPIQFMSESPSTPLTFDVLFKYAYNHTMNEPVLGGTTN